MGNSSVLGSNDFRVRGNRLIEVAFATLTCAVTIRLENASVDDGNITANENTHILTSIFCHMHFMNAKKLKKLNFHSIQNCKR